MGFFHLWLCGGGPRIGAETKNGKELPLVTLLNRFSDRGQRQEVHLVRVSLEAGLRRPSVTTTQAGDWRRRRQRRRRLPREFDSS